ncbi:MAG: ABC transporter permease [Clostridia bacterium]|nr:ABC transporter permease [Clostridia bacterium]
MDNNIKKSQKKAEFSEWFAKQKKELIKNFNIVKQLVKRNVKVQYRNSAIGVVWTILNPLLNMLVMFLVFSSFFAPSGNERNTYALYLLCGNIVFGMLRGATVQSLPSLVYNRGLLTKNKMSFNVFPLSCNLSALVNFAFSFIALFVVMVVVWFGFGVGNVFSPNIFLTLVMLPALFLFTYGLSLLLSALYVFFRDIMHFYTVFLTLWTYLTPIFYTTDKFAGAGTFGKIMLTVIKLNPMYHFVEYFRDVAYRCAVTGAPLPTFGDTMLLYVIGLAAVLVGAIVFLSTKRRFIFNI